MCESSAINMEDLLACRVCLTTGVKLYDMYHCSLDNAYENLTGISMTISEGHPRHLCVYCMHLLIKSNGFKDRCLEAQKVLEHSIAEVPVLTQDHIKSLSIALSSTQCLTISPQQTSTTILPTEVPIKEEQEIDVILKLEQSERTEFESDEEPLSKKAKKKKIIDYNQIDFDDNFDSDQKLDYSEFDSENFDRQDVLNFPEIFANEIGAESFGKDGEELNSNEIEVITLSKQEQIDEVLARKHSYNYQNSFYKCELCYKGFVTDSTFQNHMQRHSSTAGRVRCDVCHTRWPDIRSLKAHVTTAHKRRYNCRLCEHTTKSCHRAKEHVKWHLGHSYVCKLCGATFAKSTSHLTHLRMRHPSKYCCELCGATFISQNGLNIHKKKSHRSTENTRETIQNRCEICNFNFHNMDALKQHTRLSENSTCATHLCPCPICGNNFECPEVLMEHQKTHQKAEPTKCEVCNRTFAHERSYAIHYQRKHLGLKLNYKREDARSRPTVVCEICGKKCISNTTLILHQRTHTGEKPYQCTECPKRFSVHQRLQIHIRTHTNERPFKCTHCPKAFKHKAALNRHDRVHTGAKPYHCPHCSKSFSQSNSMKTHVKTVHLKLPAPYRNKRNNKINEII